MYKYIYIYTYNTNSDHAALSVSPTLIIFEEVVKNIYRIIYI